MNTGFPEYHDTKTSNGLKTVITGLVSIKIKQLPTHIVNVHRTIFKRLKFKSFYNDFQIKTPHSLCYNSVKQIVFDTVFLILPDRVLRCLSAVTQIN